MEISSETKIAALLKENPKALDAIVSINAQYKKLKNPFLRKILAARVSISDAAKVGGVSIQDFFDKLLPLGFIPAKQQANQNAKINERNGKPMSYSLLLDVREELENGKDPFSLIMNYVKKLQENQTLLLINSFVPMPLIKILEKKGFEISYFEEAPKLVKTFITRNSEGEGAEDVVLKRNNIAACSKEFGNSVKVINVKDLEMPGPMMMILEELKKLPSHYALHVYHKKVPVYLLPELQDLGYEACIEEHSDNNVELLIYKKSK